MRFCSAATGYRFFGRTNPARPTQPLHPTTATLSPRRSRARGRAIEGFDMTTIALPQRAPLRLNWPRVGAFSGTLSLHVLAVALLLVPPTAARLLQRPAADPVIVTLIDPEPIPPPPPKMPEPAVRPHPAPLPRRVPIANVTPPLPPIADMQSSIRADPSPPGPVQDVPAPPADTAPTPLAYLTRTRIPYPHIAAQRHEQGTVILRVLVGADGLPQRVEIEHSSGSRALDDAARAAVGRWTFQPGTLGGARSAMWARVPIAFRLDLL